MSLHTQLDASKFDSTIVFEISHPEKYVAQHALRILGLTPERIFADLNIAAIEMRKMLRWDKQKKARKSSVGLAVSDDVGAG